MVGPAQEVEDLALPLPALERPLELERSLLKSRDDATTQ